MFINNVNNDYTTIIDPSARRVLYLMCCVIHLLVNMMHQSYFPFVSKFFPKCLLNGHFRLVFKDRRILKMNKTFFSKMCT